MPGPFTARTSYVADRIRQTQWADRRIIVDLIQLETLFSGQRLGGWHMLSLRNGVMPKFAVEAIIIEEEMRTGVRLSLVEALERLAELSATQYTRQEAERARERAEQEQRERKDYDAWLDAGGLP